MWRDPGTYVDILVEFVFNLCNALLGVMVLNGVATVPPTISLVVAGLSALAMTANHVRALRRPNGAVPVSEVKHG